MTGKHFCAAVGGLVVILGAQSVSQAGAKYEIDSENSAVLFKVKNRDVSYVHGRFKGVSGSISADSLFNPTSFTFNVVVKAGSVDTNSKKRDRHISGKEFFNTSKYRKITFKSKSCKKLEDNQFEVVGNLTMLGKSKEITVVFHLIGSKKIGPTDWRLGGEVNFTIKRSEYGMITALDTIADEVEVTVSLEGAVTIHPAG